MRYHPRLTTRRLLLRPFVAEDAAKLQELAGSREVADGLIAMPHPLSAAAARSLIAAQAHSFQAETSVHFALDPSHEGALVGGCELRDIDAENLQAELSFWVGRDWWGRGYATEAAAAALQYAFESLGLNRVYAHHILRSPAPGSVLRRLGMKQEGILRQRVRKWGVFEDVALYAALRGDVGLAHPAG